MSEPTITWKEYVDKADATLSDRLKAFEDDSRRVSAAHNISHDREHQMTETAVQTAVVPMDKRIQQLTDDQKLLATQESVSTKIDQLTERVTQNREDMLSRFAVLERAINLRNETTSSRMAMDQGGSELARWAIPVLITLAAVVVATIALVTR